MEKPGDFERCSVFETKMLLGSSDDGGLSGKEATKRLREYGGTSWRRKDLRLWQNGCFRN